LQQPDSQAVTVTLTPELKEKYSHVSGMVVDLLRANCDGPIEAYMILHFVQHSFEENYGIRAGFAIGQDKDS
jgi:hypothetical protein